MDDKIYEAARRKFSRIIKAQPGYKKKRSRSLKSQAALIGATSGLTTGLFQPTFAKPKARLLKGSIGALVGGLVGAGVEESRLRRKLKSEIGDIVRQEKQRLRRVG